MAIKAINIKWNVLEKNRGTNTKLKDIKDILDYGVEKCF